MVDRIVDAASRVLIAHGYDGTSANRIAQEAGVSPGSLYQYFPNKDAIIVALLDRYSADVTARIAGRLASLLDAPPRTIIESVLDALIEALAERRELLGAVYDEIPRRDGIERFSVLKQRSTDLGRAYLLLHRDELGEVDIDAVIWMGIEVAEHIAVRYVLDEPPIAREDFVAMIADIAVVAFTRGPA